MKIKTLRDKEKINNAGQFLEKFAFFVYISFTQFHLSFALTVDGGFFEKFSQFSQIE